MAIFCDDIREEKSGKNLYIGVYGDAVLVLKPPPTNVAPFHIAVHLFVDRTEPINGLILHVAFPDEPSDSLGRDYQIKTTTLPEDPRVEGVEPDPWRRVMFKLRMSRLPISKFGRLRLAVKLNGRLINVGSILVALAPPELQLTVGPVIGAG